jgi:hypothetical protein
MSEKKAPATKRGRDESPNSSSSDNSEIAEIFKTRGKQKKTKQRKKQYVGRPSAPFNEYVDDSDTSIRSTDAISPQGALLPPTFTASPPRHDVIPPPAPESAMSSLSLSGGLDDAFANMDVTSTKKKGGKTKKSKRKTRKFRKTKRSRKGGMLRLKHMHKEKKCRYGDSCRGKDGMQNPPGNHVWGGLPGELTCTICGCPEPKLTSFGEIPNMLYPKPLNPNHVRPFLEGHNNE